MPCGGEVLEDGAPVAAPVVDTEVPDARVTVTGAACPPVPPLPAKPAADGALVEEPILPPRPPTPPAAVAMMPGDWAPVVVTLLVSLSCTFSGPELPPPPPVPP